MLYIIPLTPPTTQVCHPWRCEWSLYGRCWAAQGGIWSFSPLSCWNVNTPVAWICQMSTWYFKVPSWLWLFFFFFYFSPGRRRGCSALWRRTHKLTCMHTRCCSAWRYGGSGDTGWAGPHTCTYTRRHNGFNFRLHARCELTHTHIRPALRHSLTWPCV